MGYRVGNSCLLAAAGGGVFLDCVFDHLTGFASKLLNTTDQFFLLAFSVAEVVCGRALVVFVRVSGVFCLRLLCPICMKCRCDGSGFQAEVDARDESNWSLLKLSALKGHVAVAAMLLQATVTVDAADADVRTQLQYAGWNGHAAVAEVLL